MSKDVQRLRDYEAALLKHYQLYLKALLKASSAPLPPAAAPKGKGKQRAAAAAAVGGAALGTARVAVKCMAALLTSLPHFNYA